MVLKRSAPARRCASAAVSSGSTATDAVWGWREGNGKVRSSTMTTTITTTTSRAPRLLFIMRESAATALRRPGPARGRAANYAVGAGVGRVATRCGGHPLPAVWRRRLGRPAAGPRLAARRGTRDPAIPIPGYSHPRPRNRPRGPVRAGARLALLGRPVSRPPAPLPPRRRRRVRDDGFVAAGAGARAAGAVLPAPRARGAGRGTAARQARLPGRAGRADPRAARARVEPRGHRACAPGERPLVADVDRRGLLEAKLLAGGSAARLGPWWCYPA